jgi:hypothetical protein
LIGHLEVSKMREKQNLYNWLVANWALVSIPLAIFLIVISPFVFKGIGFPAILIYLLLPLYMFPQYEEHSQNQFKLYVNHLLAQGKEIFTDRAIFYINILGVWLAYSIILYLYVFVDPAWGLVAGYMTALNGLGHIGMSIKKREYNPGLWTSLFLFIPLGIYTIYEIGRQSGAGWVIHLAALGAAVLIHAVIMIYVARKLHGKS